MKELLKGRVWNPVFDGDEDFDLENPVYVNALSVYEAIEDKESDEAKNAAQVVEVVKKGLSKSLFSQEDVNGFLSKDKKTLQKAHQKTLDELTLLKKRANLSAEERAELEKKIEHTQLTLQSKEEMAQQEREKLVKNHGIEVKALTGDRDNWRKLYETSTIETAITNAAVTQKAFSPKQIISYLGPMTRLIEAIDEKGKPDGSWVPEVTFKDVKDKKPIVLKLSPSDAVKRMKEMDEHMNLFQGEGVDGLHRFQQKKGDSLDAKEIAQDPVAYRKARKEGTLQF